MGIMGGRGRGEKEESATAGSGKSDGKSRLRGKRKARVFEDGRRGRTVAAIKHILTGYRTRGSRPGESKSKRKALADSFQGDRKVLKGKQKRRSLA